MILVSYRATLLYRKLYKINICALMNNIFLPNDPLLYNQQVNYKQLYEDRLMCDRDQIDKQYKEYMSKFQNQKYEDKLEQLNTQLQNMDQDTKAQLQQNDEFVNLNKSLQDSVQAELINLVRDTINTNPTIVDNINKQLTIINELNNRTKEEDRKNMLEINDYIKNYSNMTFDEYKKLKDACK